MRAYTIVVTSMVLQERTRAYVHAHARICITTLYYYCFNHPFIISTTYTMNISLSYIIS